MSGNFRRKFSDQFKINRRFVLICALLSGIFFTGGFIIRAELPYMRSWALMRIEKLSQEHLPARILPGSISFQLFPLGVSLKSVKIFPKQESITLFDPFAIGEVELDINAWRLLQGRLLLRRVALRDGHVNIRVPKSTAPHDADHPLKGLFDNLAKLPLREFVLSNIDLGIALEERKMRSEITGIELTAQNEITSLSVQLSANSIYLLDHGTGAELQVQVDTDITADKNQVLVTSAKLRRGSSFVVASGTLTGDTEALSFPKIDLSSRGLLELDSMKTLAVQLFNKLHEIPELKGVAQTEIKFNREQNKPDDIDFDLTTHQLSVDKFYIGEAHATGSYHEQTLLVPELSVSNDAGEAVIKDIKIKTAGNYPASAKLQVRSIQLHEFLKNLHIGDIPVWLTVSGNAPCEGSLKPNPELICKADAHGGDVLIKGDAAAKKPIVKIKQFDAKGIVKIDSEEVTYNAELAMPNSKGSSTGVINYETGFKIGYEGVPLDMRDIASLAELKIEGSATVSGSTEGNAHTAQASMHIDGKNVWFEDYGLGEVSGDLKYAKSTLLFSRVSGHAGISRYQADLQVDLHNRTISADAKAPFLDARDALTLFSRKVSLPFQLSGTGATNVKVWGPLEFTKLNYDFQSSLFHGSAAHETFDEAHFDVHSRNGEVKADRAIVQKENATITMTGEGHPNGQIQNLIQARGLKLEDLTFVTNSGLKVSGLLDFDMHLNGAVLKPDTDLQGKITKTSIGDQAVQDSDFNFRISSTSIRGSGKLFGDTISSSFILPLDEKAPFSLQLSTQDWNFAPLFSSLAGVAGHKDYDAKLTGTLSLSAPTGGFWNATGNMNLSKFSLKRGSLQMSASKPLIMLMSQGKVQTKNFEISGENTFIKVTDNASPIAKLDVQVNSKIDMNLLALILPFFEDLRGILSTAFNIRMGPKTSELLGSAYIDHGYLKLFDFPHPFEDFKADVLFNQSRVLINSIKGDFANGRFSAEGQVDLHGYKNYPVRLNVTADKIQLNIPDGYRTNGSGQLSISGNWFPFHLKGVYDISAGLITAEFGADSAPTGARRSNFLPQSLLQDSFSPLSLDLQLAFASGINIKNSLFDGMVNGELNLTGTPSKPVLLGNVTASNTSKLKVHDQEFEIATANFNFDDPNQINPKLYVNGRARVQEYDITLLAQGTGQKPQINFSSVPSLSEPDIISLLALGSTNAKIATDTTAQTHSQNQNNGGAFAVGAAILQNNPLGKGLKDHFDVDLQFTTSYDDTKSVAVQKVSLNGKVSDKLSWTVNQAVAGSAGNDANLRYRLSDRFSLVGSWEKLPTGKQNERSRDTIPDVFGFDLEYRFRFK